MERRLEKRREWADKAAGRAAAACDTAHRIGERFEMGQPILVGHHSEAKARRDQGRMDSCMHQAVENTDKARHHESKATNLEAALERTIFDDDQDAIERLEERAAAREAEAEHCKFVNAQFKRMKRAMAKGGGGYGTAKVLAELVRLAVVTEAEGVQIAKTMALCPWESAPHPGYHLTNLRASIRRDRDRIEQIKARREAGARAEAAGGVEIKDVGNGAVLVTFAEKPEREILDALKAAGFWWGKGSWYGPKDKLPACVAGTGGGS
jgi:hypothetical protein